MTGMELYVKFVFTLTVGLAGVGLVLTTVLETLFADWDPVVDFRRWWRQHSHRGSGVAAVRAEDILQELESRRQGGSRPAVVPARSIDRRRESLRTIAEVEERLAAPRGL